MTPDALISRINDRPGAAAGVVAGGVVLIAAVDFFSGVELRVFPLYYAPIALAAWTLGHRATLLACAGSAIGWFIANQLAGLQFSHPLIWAANTCMQGASFAIVGLLVAHMRRSVTRERALSRTDSLSGLMNHRAFYEESDRLLRLCRRGRRAVTLAYLDLDNFKTVNDSQGHLAGDDLLRAVGELLQSTLRASDLTARLGGDEFAVLLPELGPAEAGSAIKRLHDEMSRLMAGRRLAGVTVSIGAVTALVAPESVELLVQKADAVMYGAKRAGKNQCCLEVDDAAGVGQYR